MSLELRAVVEHIPDKQYELLGICREEDCLPQIQVGGITFYRAQSTARWVLYKRAISGHGERTPLHPQQR